MRAAARVTGPRHGPEFIRPRIGVSLWLSVAMLLSVARPALAAPTSGPTLDVVLSRLDRVAALYRDNALRFTCEETIVHRATRNPPRKIKLEYIYVFTDEHGLEDYRVPYKAARKNRKAAEKRKDGGGKPPVEIADLSTYGLPAYLQRAYSWIFLFQAGRHPYLHYEMQGTDQALGRPAIKVAFEPVAPYYRGINDWYGTAWVDAETFQPLRVEAWEIDEFRKRQRFQDSLERAARAHKRYHSSHTVQRVVTDYGVVKNGMRFPSEVTSHGSRYVVWSNKSGSGYQDYPLYDLTQTYDNYRFFGVRTTAEIDRVIWADTDDAEPR